MSDEALAAFVQASPATTIEPLGRGHIHRTYRARLGSRAGQRDVVLQRLNTRVFPDPDAVMRNLVIACDAQRRALGERADIDRRVLEPLPARQGGWLWRDPGGGVWRAFRHIDGAAPPERVDSPAMAHDAARAFAAFDRHMAAHRGPPLTVTIAHFHDPPRRLEALRRACRADPLGRVRGVRDTLADVEALAPYSRGLVGPLGAGDIPVRVAHNDAKVDNVLFDTAERTALCVVDLDTVMPGTPLDDFGDLVRSSVSDAPEDCPDPDAVEVDGERYEALVAGFLEGSGPGINRAERALMPVAAVTVTYELGIRFLTDHLEGDGYFGVTRPGQNLDRARCQIRLAMLLEDAIIRRGR